MRDAPLVAREVLAGEAQEVAPAVLGLLLVTDEVVARVVEVEAYGRGDPANHAFRGERPRNRVMFDAPGRLYVYVSHGIHHLGNVVVDDEGVGAAVLLRSVEVLDGHDVAVARRGGHDRPSPRWLGGGPGRLGQLLGLRADAHDGTDLLDPTAPVTLRDDGTRYPEAAIAAGPRVGVTDAPDVPWRWWVADHPAVSRYSRSPRAAPPQPGQGTSM